MKTELFRVLVVTGMICLIAATVLSQDTPETTPEATAAPDVTGPPDSLTGVDPVSGEWLGTRFYRPQESEMDYITRLTFETDDTNTITGVLTIFTEQVPENAVELVSTDGCVIEFEALPMPRTGDGVYAAFINPTEAVVTFSVTTCQVKFFGEVTFDFPIIGTWRVDYQPNGIPVIDESANLTPIERGAEIYGSFCSECHGLYMEGAPGYPALTGEESKLPGMSDEDILEVLYNGVDGTEMGPYASMYTSDQVQALMLLLRNPDVLLP